MKDLNQVLAQRNFYEKTLDPRAASLAPHFGDLAKLVLGSAIFSAGFGVSQFRSDEWLGAGWKVFFLS